MHRSFHDLWLALPDRLSTESAQQFWDHVATTPGAPPAVGSTTILKGKAGRPRGEGWSRTIHYEISGAGRLDFQFHDTYRIGPDGDPHPVVFILTISLSSH